MHTKNGIKTLVLGSTVSCVQVVKGNMLTLENINLLFFLVFYIVLGRINKENRILLMFLIQGGENISSIIDSGCAWMKESRPNK